MASEEILAVLSYATGTPLALREAPHHAGQTFLYASPRLQDRAMATEESSHKAYKEIRDHGYFHIHKASLGERLTKPSAPWSPDSLRIWYDYLDNETMATINELIPDPTLVGAVTLTPTSRSWCYLPRVEMITNPTPGGIIVIFWGSDSEVAFFKGSQTHAYDSQEFEQAVEGAGFAIQAQGDRNNVTISEGGMSIADFSLAVQVLKGRALVYVFGTWPLVKTWRKIVVPLSAAEWIERAKREKGFRSHLVYE